MAHEFLRLLSQLHDAKVEFVIIGGVAAALHGGSRVTFDLDVVPSLELESWHATVDLLWSLGARPRIPEPLEKIRDPEKVRTWIEEKGMLALSFRTSDGGIEVDLLVAEADRFESLQQRAHEISLEGRRFFVASIDDLVEMKNRAGRPQDLLDVAQLLDIKARLARRRR